MRLPLFFLFLSFACATFSQDTLSSVVNTYAAVQGIEHCTGQLTLGPKSGNFLPGQKVLLLQMQGATIDASNSPSFGNILQLNQAGNFEENEVIAVVADKVWLKNTLLHNYEVSGSVQLISFPSFNEAVLLDSVVPLPWNGAYGGVLAIQNSGSSTLLSAIAVDGKGFGDELPLEVVSNCTWLTFANNYYYDASNWRGAPKGQGIASFIEGKEHGRGPQGNGGGGGNDHNSGGGGGAHAGAGGQGGQQTPSSALGCYGNYPGLGGKALPLSQTSLFMGGEGGNGHVDDTNAGSPGARGGGILILKTDTLITNDFGLSTNGNTPPLAGGDGAGGGGAGGSIYLLVDTLIGNLSLSARGGAGGDVINPTNRCFGPGGGGSGGRIIAPANANILTNVAGGEAGENTTASAQCNGPSNGATPGENGLIEGSFAIPSSSEAFVETQILEQPQPLSICEGDSSEFQFQVQGNFLHYQWQVNENGNWQELPNDTLPELSQLPGNITEGLYRCVVSSPCAGTLVSDEILLTVLSTPTSDFDFIDDGDGMFQFLNNSQNALIWHWDFGDGSLSNEENPTHHYLDYGIYPVQLIAGNACGSDTLVSQLIFEPAPAAAFGFSPAEGCVPLTVVFTNNSTGDSLQLEWSFSGGNPSSSTEPNPVVIYQNEGSFDAQLVVENSFGTDTLFQPEAVLIHPVPTADFSFTMDSLSVQFENQSQGGLSYFWEFGDGNASTGENPGHTYLEPGNYEVTLTVSNGSCGATVAKTISVIPNAVDEAIWAGLRIYPNPSWGIFHLSFGREAPLSHVEIQVFNSLGIELLSANSNSPEMNLDLSSQPDGLYWLVLKKEDKHTYSPLLIAK